MISTLRLTLVLILLALITDGVAWWVPFVPILVEFVWAVLYLAFIYITYEVLRRPK